MANAKPFVLPRRVQVGPYSYKLWLDDGLDSESAYGETDNSKMRIGFSSSHLCTENHVLVTLVHEIMHAVSYVYEVELSEKDTKRLAHGLTQALQSAGLLPERAVLEDGDA